MKKFLFFIPLLLFLAFPLSAFASAGSFDPSNITFDTQTLTFDLSNLNPSYGGWSVTNIDIYNNDLSNNIYSTSNNPSNVNCNSTLTHCSANMVFYRGSGFDMSQVHLLVWLNGAPIPYYLSPTIDMSSFPTPTPSPTPTATPTPTPLPQFNLTGNVYVDANSNGVKDTGESNYQALSVDTGGNASGTSQHTAPTDANGNYSFTNVPYGNYWISLAVPSGYMGTTKALVNVIINDNTTENFGIVQQTSNPTVFSDDFTDTDGTPLNTHNSAWQLLSGTTMPVIQNNTLSGGAEIGLPNIDLTDQCASYDFQYPSHGIVVLYAWRILNQYYGYGAYLNQNSSWNGSGGYDFAMVRAPSNTYFSGGFTFPTSALITGWHNFKLCAIGSQITAYLDNSVLNSVTDTHFTHGITGANLSTGNYIDNFKLTTTNRPPSVGAITVSPNPVQVNTATTASASFTDPDTADTHNNSGTYWNWGDGNTTTGTVTESGGSGSVSDSHIYSTAGVYTVTLTVTDNHGASGQSTFQYVSVYNPTSQGLFTAGQHFTSPAGAYTANTSLTGTVKFGLSYKYQGTMPASDRQFTMNFPAASLNFNAITISSLVIANSMATLTGTGNINGGSHTYNFLVTGVNGGGIRIQITDPSNNNAVIFDTQPGDPTTATPTTSVTGNVIAHN